MNPPRAGLVPDLKQLSGFVYCGHSRIMGTVKSGWQDVDKVLGMFSAHGKSARIFSFPCSSVGTHTGSDRSQGLHSHGGPWERGEGRKPGLTGGGLVRSVGGWQELNALGREKVHFKSDERILGDSDFVETVLDFASEEMERKYRLKADGYTFEGVGKRVAELFDMSHSDVTTPGKQPRRVQARSVLSFRAVHELGMSATAVGLKLGLSQSATSRAVQRGRVITRELGLNPNRFRNA